jgi:hypothetical protein
MARTLIPVTTSTHDGDVYPGETESDPANGMEIESNDAATILILQNMSGSTRTVTVQAAATFGDPPISLEDRVYTLGIGTAPDAMQVAGPFSKRLFNQVGDHSAQSVLVDFDGIAGDVDIVAISVPIPVA